MRNKFKLAVISIILQATLQVIRDLYPGLRYTGDGIYRSLRYLLPILNVLSVLGVLPVLIALYRNSAFALHADGSNPSSISDSRDEGFIRHLGIRVLTIVSICVLFFLFANFERGLSGAYLVIYGIMLLLGIGTVFLVIEAVILYRKRRNYSASGNMILVLIMLCLLLGFV
ncbi:hypothetical protein INP83_11860 [Mucilaginibacter sp. 21P]|uniref:hypothetical protein n=1 Tax=Mucilaginibacter sp. 21P TaxID=2778902 RepID=UPI001C59FEDF|nr:hypothetical protein [Mucilaginibacter sp. 21P]QXV63801.1 hypothetical protein INP83_11860 [Mucilaginibacter sp. 21P]